MFEQFVLQKSMVEYVAKGSESDCSRNYRQVEECGYQHDDVVRDLIREIELRILKLGVCFKLSHIQRLSFFVLLKAEEALTFTPKDKGVKDIEKGLKEAH